MILHTSRSTLFPYTTLFRSLKETEKCQNVIEVENKSGKKVKYYLADNDVSKDFHKNICKETKKVTATGTVKKVEDRKSTRLNSSHTVISYAVFCLKKKTKKK